MLQTAHMGKNESEADARIVIDDLLRKAGWDPADKSQVRTEVTTKRLKPELKEQAGTAEGDDEILRADYTLLSTRGRNLSVVEAKRKAIDPYTAKNHLLKSLREAMRLLPDGSVPPEVQKALPEIYGDK